MMLYCGGCCRLFSGSACPSCGAAGRVPRPDDFCFLTEKEQLWADMLAEVLEENTIPFLQKGKLGAGLAMKMGPLLEQFRFYVPYAHFDAAAAIVEELFGGRNE